MYFWPLRACFEFLRYLTGLNNATLVLKHGKKFKIYCAVVFYYKLTSPTLMFPTSAPET